MSLYFCFVHGYVYYRCLVDEWHQWSSGDGARNQHEQQHPVYEVSYISRNFLLDLFLIALLFMLFRNEFEKKKEGVEKMLLDLVLKVDTTVPKGRVE